MEFQQMQVIAGSISSLIFIVGAFPMLLKAFGTKDLHSYSLENIAINNLANLIHWLYVSSLPFGPIWFLHGFFTITTFLMLIWYLRFEKGWIHPFSIKGSSICNCQMTVSIHEMQGKLSKA